MDSVDHPLPASRFQVVGSDHEHGAVCEVLDAQSGQSAPVQWPDHALRIVKVLNDWNRRAGAGRRTRNVPD